MITTIINFCTFDWRCIGKCIEEAKKYSSQVLVPVCDHFFNGKKEDRPLLDAIYRKNTDVEFIEFPYLHDRFYYEYVNCPPEHPDWINCWHSTSLYIAFFYLHAECEYVHFIDADEIYEGERIKERLKAEVIDQYDAFRFERHYYFREARFRAANSYNEGLMAKKDALTPKKLFHPLERFETFSTIGGKALENIRGLDGKPMMQHYSWVRTKEECLRKSDFWGHQWEKPWKDLIEEEFSRPFNGKDFVFEYEYEEHPPEFDPFSVTEKDYPLKSFSETFPHVRKVNEQEISLKLLEYEFL